MEEDYLLLRLATADRKDTPDRFITLYKGGLSTMKIFLEPATTSADARDPALITSAAPSDFCIDPAIYLTPQWEIAKYYARLRGRISGLGNGNVGVLTIYVR